MKQILFVILLLLLFVPSMAQAQQLTQDTLARLQVGEWVKLDDPSPVVKEHFMTGDGCGVIVTNADVVGVPNGVRLLSYRTGEEVRSVVIFQVDDRPVYVDDSTVGGKRTIVADDPAFAACATKVKTAKGLPERVKRMFLGFQGIR